MRIWINESEVLNADARDVYYSYVSVMPICIQILSKRIKSLQESSKTLTNEDDFLTVPIIPDRITAEVRPLSFYKKNYLDDNTQQLNLTVKNTRDFYDTYSTEMVIKLEDFPNGQQTSNINIVDFSFYDVLSSIKKNLYSIYTSYKNNLKIPDFIDSDLKYLSDINNNVPYPMYKYIRFFKNSDVYQSNRSNLPILYSDLILQGYTNLVNSQSYTQGEKTNLFRLYTGTLYNKYIHDDLSSSKSYVPDISDSLERLLERLDILNTVCLVNEPNGLFYAHQSSLAYALKVSDTEVYEQTMKLLNFKLQQDHGFSISL